MKTCVKCGKQTTNPKFCSRSCSASYNNSVSPKRKAKQHGCKACGKIIPGNRLYCLDHSPNNRDYTKEEMRTRQKYQLNSGIRIRARSVTKRYKQVCYICGYDKHVEVCHISPISSFPDSTLLSEINSPSNLVLLCPNCHWELDNNLLRIHRNASGDLNPGSQV